MATGRVHHRFAHPGRPRATAALLVLLGFLIGTTASGQDPSPREFAFPERNQLYPDLEVTPEPVLWGPLVVRLTAPRAALRVSEHRVMLTPRSDGSHGVWAEVQFSGAGTLVADLEVLGMATRKTDEVLLPRQTQTQEGRVRVERGQEGYRVTPLELPRQVRLQIRSRLVQELVSWCTGLPLLSLAGVDCGGLRSSLSTVTIPLPPPGETYLVSYGELTAEERLALDRYLDETAVP